MGPALSQLSGSRAWRGGGVTGWGFDRCWRGLCLTSLDEFPLLLLPDASEDAPELVEHQIPSRCW